MDISKLLKGIDTSKLSREQKLELITLLEEKAKRDLVRRPKYKPEQAQLAVITSRALERYLFCGNGFGKSTILVNEVHWAATGYNPITDENSPVPAKICLVIDAPEKIEDFIAEYRKWHPLEVEQLHKRGKANYSQITYENGSTISVLTHEVNALKLEGSQWTHIFFEEPPPKKVFTGIARGGRIKGRPLRILLAGTPLAAAWLRTEIYEPWTKGELSNVECFRGMTDDNAANLDMDSVKRTWQKLSAQELKIRREGAFFDLEGLALSHLFRRLTHTIPRSQLEWQRSYPTIIVIDPHPSKAHHAVLLGADKDNRLYVLEEYKERAVARKFIKSLIGKGWFHNYRILDIIYDSLGNSEMTSGEGFKPFGTVINEVLKQHSLGHARATTYEEKSDEDFIERIQDSLVMPDKPDNFGMLVPKLRVVSDCVGTIGDIENVQWARDRRTDENKPHLDITSRDYLSCVKYGLASNLKGNKGKDKIYYPKGKAYGVDLTEAVKRNAEKKIKRNQDKDDWDDF